jgi:DNA topoisomerase VI subunit B
MSAWIEKLLINLAWALIERAASRAGKELKEYFDERAELERNKRKAENYDKIVRGADSTREERRKAEDDLLDN